MKTTIKNKTKWMHYCGIAGMTATEWVRQVLGYDRETETKHGDVMSNLRIGGWSHSYHYAGNHRIENTQHALDALTYEVKRLAKELDRRLHDLTAVENELREMVKEDSMANDQIMKNFAAGGGTVDQASTKPPSAPGGNTSKHQPAMPNQSTPDLGPTPSDKGAVKDRPQAIYSRLPFTPPFRLISEFRCGTDAHVVDAAGNIVIETSTWASNPEINHKSAMLLIVDALNEKFPENAERTRGANQNQP